MKAEMEPGEAVTVATEEPEPEEAMGEAVRRRLKITRDYRDATRRVEMSDDDDDDDDDGNSDEREDRASALPPEAGDGGSLCPAEFELTVKSRNSVIRIRGFDGRSTVCVADGTETVIPLRPIKCGEGERKSKPATPRPKKNTWKVLAKSLAGVRGVRKERRGSVERYPKMVLLQEEPNEAEEEKSRVEGGGKTSPTAALPETGRSRHVRPRSERRACARDAFGWPNLRPCPAACHFPACCRPALCRLDGGARKDAETQTAEAAATEQRPLMEEIPFGLLSGLFPGLVMVKSYRDGASHSESKVLEVSESESGHGKEEEGPQRSPEDASQLERVPEDGGTGGEEDVRAEGGSEADPLTRSGRRIYEGLQELSTERMEKAAKEVGEKREAEVMKSELWHPSNGRKSEKCPRPEDVSFSVGAGGTVNVTICVRSEADAGGPGVTTDEAEPCPRMEAPLSRLREKLEEAGGRGDTSRGSGWRGHRAEYYCEDCLATMRLVEDGENRSVKGAVDRFERIIQLGTY